MLLFSTEEVLTCLPSVSAAVVEGSSLLILFNRDWRDIERDVQALQERAQKHKSTLFNELCRTLITPLDPEDIFHLSSMMIATLDEIAAAIENFRLWFPSSPPAPLVELCHLLTSACASLDRALRDFLDGKLKAEQFRDFPVMRAKANRVVNGALAQLFDSETDTTVLLRNRDLYKHPHAAVARCCETAAALRSIALKNG